MSSGFIDVGIILFAFIVIAGIIFFFFKKRKSEPVIKREISVASIKILSIVSLVVSISAVVLVILEFIFNWLIFVWLPVILMFILGLILSVTAFTKYKMNENKEGKVLVISSLIVSILLLLGICVFTLLVMVSFSRGI